MIYFTYTNIHNSIYLIAHVHAIRLLHTYKIQNKLANENCYFLAAVTRSPHAA